MGFVNVHTRTHARSAWHLSPFVLFILSRCVVVLLILRNPVFVIKFKGTVVLFPSGFASVSQDRRRFERLVKKYAELMTILLTLLRYPED